MYFKMFTYHHNLIVRAPLHWYVCSITLVCKLHNTGMSSPLRWYVCSITQVCVLHYTGMCSPL